MECFQVHGLLPHGPGWFVRKCTGLPHRSLLASRVWWLTKTGASQQSELGISVRTC